MSKKNKEDQFFQRMEKMLGSDEARQLIEGLKPLPPKSVRYNRLQSHIFPTDASRVPWCSHGYYWQDSIQPSRTVDYVAGRYYIQESSAMLPVAAAESVVDFHGKIVLDMTAAPGGKATQVAEIIGPGYLLANEVNHKRCDALIWNINRHRLHNVIVSSLSNEELVRAFPGHFDIVMVDAPCSGEGLFQKRQQTLSSWSEHNVRFCARRQGSILDAAVELVKPGGYIVYSTCTFSQEENEMQVEYILAKGFESVVLPPGIPVSAGISGNPGILASCRRVFPHREGGAGSFVAVVRKPVDYPGSGGSRKGVTTSRPAIHWKYDTPKINVTLPAFLLPANELNGFFYEANGITSFFSHDRIPGFLRERALQIGAPVFDKRRDNIPLFGSIQLALPAAMIEIHGADVQEYCRGGELHLSTGDGFYFISYQGMVLGQIKVTAGRGVNKLPVPLRHH